MVLNPAWFNALVNDDGTNLTGTPWTKAGAIAGLVATIDAADAAQDAAVATLFGTWTDLAYVAGNFLGSGAMTWTVDVGDVLFNRFKVVDKQITWHVQLATTTIGGTVDTTLRIKAPTGVTFPSFSEFSPVVLPAGAYVQPVASNELGVRLLAGNWTAGVNSHYVYFTFIGQVS